MKIECWHDPLSYSLLQIIGIMDIIRAPNIEVMKDVYPCAAGLIEKTSISPQFSHSIDHDSRIHDL